MLKIWGRTTSINVQKVMWLAAEMSLDVERIDAGGKFGVVDQDHFAEMNPNRRVPVLQDGDLTLWESNAILRYLAANYNSGALWPADKAQRALADQWMEWNTSSLWGALRLVFIGLIRTPPEERDEAALKKLTVETGVLFQLLDQKLGNQDFILGGQITLGDIPMGATCYRFKELDIERPATPNVDAWYQRLQDRDAYRQHVMIPLE